MSLLKAELRWASVMLGNNLISFVSSIVHLFEISCNILIYIQQDATLHSLHVFYLETAPHVLGDTTTQHQERKQLYLQRLIFVAPLLLPAAIGPGSNNGVTNTKCCGYSCLRS
jgi:hypothetical protein